MNAENNIETHPLPPFLPPEGRILMAGSFPPPRARWCIDWFYPNRTNDMWRIWGYIASGDKNYFMLPDGKTFDKDKIVNFCNDIGLGLCDTGYRVKRLKGNASDKFLEIVEPRDFGPLLDKMPHCNDIALTGEKAVETLGNIIGVKAIRLGEFVVTDKLCNRPIRVWRMPSSSRAFPRSIEWKADFYRKLLAIQ